MNNEIELNESELDDFLVSDNDILGNEIFFVKIIDENGEFGGRVLKFCREKCSDNDFIWNCELIFS